MCCILYTQINYAIKRLAIKLVRSITSANGAEPDPKLDQDFRRNSTLASKLQSQFTFVLLPKRSKKSVRSLERASL